MGPMISDMLLVVVLSISIGIVLLCMGLAFIGESLDSLKYDNVYGYGSKEPNNYYDKNPLWHYSSKYFHYRPKGTVIVSKTDWNRVQIGISAHISKAIDAGKKLGYKEAFEDIKDKVDERKERVSPSNAYMVLGVSAKTCIEDVNRRYDELMALYDKDNFIHLDESFIKLAGIRRRELTKALTKITTALEGTTI
jgi:hypothetical protein